MGSALMVAALVLPVAARADTASDATRIGAETLRGVINSIEGKHRLTLRDNRGSVDSVTLHRSAIINPTGLQLKPGTRVTIAGQADGGTYDANTIDAPLEPANRSTRTLDPGLPAEAPVPVEISSGTFQTNGPNAEGGG